MTIPPPPSRSHLAEIAATAVVVAAFIFVVMLDEHGLRAPRFGPYLKGGNAWASSLVVWSLLVALWTVPRRPDRARCLPWSVALLGGTSMALLSIYVGFDMWSRNGTGVVTYRTPLAAAALGAALACSWAVLLPALSLRDQEGDRDD